MSRKHRVILVFLLIAAALLLLGYLYPVAAPNGWFEERTEEKLEVR